MNRTRKQITTITIVGLAVLATSFLMISFLSNRQKSSPSQSPGQPTILSPVKAAPKDIFEDVTKQAGIDFLHQYCDNRIANILQSNGAGAAVLDYDNDGFMDVYLVNSGPLNDVTRHVAGTSRLPNRLYRNLGNETFEDVTEKTGVSGYGYGTAAASGDFDNDGDVDLYVVNVGPNIFYRNRGDGTFEDISLASGAAHSGTGISAVFLDYDGDGNLDLFVANYLTYDPNYKLYFNPDSYPGPLSYEPEFNVLFRNRGDGTFEDVSETTGIRVEGHRAMSVCSFDFQQDGDPDLYLSNDATPNVLLVNDGKGHFQEEGLRRGVAMNALGEAAGSMAATIGDCNGDLIQDILVTRLGYGSLYMGSRKGLFDDQMNVSGLGALTSQFVAWGGSFLDFDNDGDRDIFIANGSAHYLSGWESLLLENSGPAKFMDAADKGGTFFKTPIRGRGSATWDFNNDGQMDLLITTLADRTVLLKNRHPAEHHWLTLVLQGNQSNRSGYGALVTVKAGDQTQFSEQRCATGFLTQSDPRLHFGIGQATQADQIDIRWPSGVNQVLKDIRANQILKIVEPTP